tara:strand:+ start:316 stop:897 length:582 start_codon:yes stop_codon:yes gene_type:complete
MENIRISDALQVLTPGAEWSIGNNSYSQLDWLDTKQTKPTEEEIVQKIAELTYQREVEAYKQQRAAEYPSYADQFDKIFHEGVDAWKADIQAVKDTYPKVTMDATELQTRKDKSIFDLQTERYVAAAKRLELDAVVASDDIPATIEVDAITETLEPTKKTIRNPVIVKDEEERAAAQTVVDATPQSVIDSIVN